MQIILEFIVQFFLVGTGSFVRWMFIRKKDETFKYFFKNKTDYMWDIFIGSVFWTALSYAGYLFYKYWQSLAV